MSCKIYWDAMVEQANRTRRILDDKPQEFKIGHWQEPGSILNAFREGDITFDEAYEELIELINDQGAG